MKTRILTSALAMLSIMAFAQKKEIKRAGKAVDKGEYQEALAYLNEAEPLLANAKEDQQADFYLYKGYALIGDGENLQDAELMAAVEAFKKAKELGHNEADAGIATASNALVTAAISDQNNEKFTTASEKLYAGYQLNKQDTLYLYYAASNSVNAQDYETALEYYNELKNLGFTGIQTEYTAVNKETGEVETMASKEQRDLFVKTGNYTDPQEQVSESKKGEIAKNIALIYINNGQTEEAIAAMEEAKSENPEDTGLLQAEADMYYQLGDMEKYRSIMEEVVAKDPDNPVLFYNLGVSTSQLGDNEKALEYYNKALELDPELANARLNIAFITLSQEAEIVEEMNKLGTSKADNKRYDELMEKRQEIYRDAIPHLEKVLENDSTNVEAARTMMNIYYQLNEPEKAEEMKQKVAEMEAGL